MYTYREYIYCFGLERWAEMCRNVSQVTDIEIQYVKEYTQAEEKEKCEQCEEVTALHGFL